MFLLAAPVALITLPILFVYVLLLTWSLRAACQVVKDEVAMLRATWSA